MNVPHHHPQTSRRWIAALALFALFALVLNSAATQYVAWRFAYHPALGEPWIGGLYAPWDWLIWRASLLDRAPDAFDRVNAGFALTVAVSAVVGLLGARRAQPQRHQTRGRARHRPLGEPRRDRGHRPADASRRSRRRGLCGRMDRQMGRSPLPPPRRPRAYRRHRPDPLGQGRRPRGPDAAVLAAFGGGQRPEGRAVEPHRRLARALGAQRRAALRSRRQRRQRRLQPARGDQARDDPRGGRRPEPGHHPRRSRGQGPGRSLGQDRPRLPHRRGAPCALQGQTHGQNRGAPRRGPGAVRSGPPGRRALQGDARQPLGPQRNRPSDHRRGGARHDQPPRRGARLGALHRHVVPVAVPRSPGGEERVPLGLQGHGPDEPRQSP